MELRTLVDAIGRTPLLRVSSRSLPKGAAEVLLKLEKRNPGGSLRDRVVRFALEQAAREDRLAPGARVVAAAGEDGAFSAALICAVKGHPLDLYVSSQATRSERRKAAARFGASVHVVEGGLDEARAAAEDAAKKLGATLLDVESAAIATRACAEIGLEILEATGETAVDAFVAVVRSGGTLEGVGGVLHTRFPQMAVHPVRLAGFTRVEAHGMVEVTREQALATAGDIARNEGVLVGPVSGAAIVVGRRVAETLGTGKRIVILCPDGGERFL
jgi:cysteine synthase